MNTLGDSNPGSPWGCNLKQLKTQAPGVSNAYERILYWTHQEKWGIRDFTVASRGVSQRASIVLLYHNYLSRYGSLLSASADGWLLCVTMIPILYFHRPSCWFLLHNYFLTVCEHTCTRKNSFFVLPVPMLFLMRDFITFVFNKYDCCYVRVTLREFC